MKIHNLYLYVHKSCIHLHISRWMTFVEIGGQSKIWRYFISIMFTNIRFRPLSYIFLQKRGKLRVGPNHMVKVALLPLATPYASYHILIPIVNLYINIDGSETPAGISRGLWWQIIYSNKDIAWSICLTFIHNLGTCIISHDQTGPRFVRTNKFMGLLLDT